MKSPSIHSSDLQKCILEKISRQTTSSIREVERSKLILLLLTGKSNTAIEDEYGFSWEKAKRWRYRWKDFEQVMTEVENREKKEGMEYDLEQEIRLCLSDAPRPGGPNKISAEQYCQILGVALEDPKKSGRPISHWTLNELTDEIQKRGIVSSISRSQVGSFLKRKRGEAAQNPRVVKSKMHGRRISTGKQKDL